MNDGGAGGFGRPLRRRGQARQSLDTDSTPAGRVAHPAADVMARPQATIPRRWTLVIPWDAGILAPNRVSHRMQRYRIGALGRRAAGLVWVAAGRPRAQSRVRVDITIRRARALDDDNLVSATKNLRDGVFNAALTPNDSPRWVTIGTITQDIGPQFKGREEVQFDVEEVSQ